MRYLICLLISFSSLFVDAQSWKSLDNIQFDFYLITRFEESGDSLNIFGGFRFEGTGDNDNIGVLSWDSLSISPFGNFISGGLVYSGIQYQDEFYLGGGFSDYNDDIYQKKIARWNGLEWNAVGLGIWSPVAIVEDMEVYQDKLVITGSINDIEGNEDFWCRFGYWQDTTWHTMGGAWGGDTEPQELIQYNDKLFVIGGIDYVSPDNIIENSWSINNIAWWDGTEWGQPDAGVNGRLWDAYLDTTNNHLYVAGLCSNASGVEVSNVAMWDGTDWHAVGDDLEGEVFCITMYRGQLYVAGFPVLGDNYLAYFDGYHWQEVPGANIDATVKDMIVYKDELYIGGYFEHAGGLEVDGLVRYYLHPDSVQWGVPDDIQVLEHEQEEKVFVYPNPANEYVKISGEDSDLINATFTLYNSSGQKLIHKEKLYRDMVVDISGLKAGSYTWEIVGDSEEVGSGVLIIQ